MEIKKPETSKKIETSKLIVLFVLGIGFLYFSFVLIIWAFLGRDGAPELAGIIIAPITTTLGFYYWKAKNENIIKIGKTLFTEHDENIATKIFDKVADNKTEEVQ